MIELRSKCRGAEIGFYLTNLTKKPAIRYCDKCKRELNPLNQPTEVEEKEEEGK